MKLKYTRTNCIDDNDDGGRDGVFFGIYVVGSKSKEYRSGWFWMSV